MNLEPFEKIDEGLDALTSDSLEATIVLVEKKLARLRALRPLVKAGETKTRLPADKPRRRRKAEPHGIELPNGEPVAVEA